MPSSTHRKLVTGDPLAGTPSARAKERVPLSKEVALDLVLCGMLLAGLSFLAQYLQPNLQRVTWYTGLAGGGLCVLSGVLGRRGKRCRGGAMVTLVVVGGVFVWQAVQSWRTSVGDESRGRTIAALMAVLVVFSVGMLATLVRDGKQAPPP